jgi:O-antigen/teichoic acid export membrane protein
MAILAIPVAVGGTILSFKVVELLYGAAYLAASVPLVVLLLSGAIVMIYGFPSSSVLYSADGENTMLWIGVSVAVSNIILALLLIPKLGALGAAWANALSQLLSIAPGLIAVNRRIQQRAPYAMLPKVLLSAGLMGLPLIPLLWLPAPVAILLSLLIGPVVYGAALIGLKALEKDDLDMALELVKGRRFFVKLIGLARG